MGYVLTILFGGLFGMVAGIVGAEVVETLLRTSFVGLDRMLLGGVAGGLGGVLGGSLGGELARESPQSSRKFFGLFAGVALGVVAVSQRGMLLDLFQSFQIRVWP